MPSVGDSRLADSRSHCTRVRSWVQRNKKYLALSRSYIIEIIDISISFLSFPFNGVIFLVQISFVIQIFIKMSTSIKAQDCRNH